MKMKISIKDVTVITLNQQPYEYKERTGVSYKADVLVDGSVEKFKLTEEVYNELEVGKNYNLQAELFIGSSNSSLKIVGLES